MLRKLKEMEEKLTQAKKEKEAYEKKFIEAKMSLSEVQMQNQGEIENEIAYIRFAKNCFQS